jgi:amino acid adenylation domain-containing protein
MSESHPPPDPADQTSPALEPTPQDLMKAEAKNQAKSQAKAEGKQLKQRIKELSPQQRDALMRRLEARRGAQERPAELAAGGREEGTEVPLSFAQEREWFRDQLFPGIAHNICGALRLEGRVSQAALSSTFDTILRRHETLRASFRAPGGKPLQTINPPSAVPISVIDLSAFPAQEREAEWRRLYRQEIEHPFDLGSGPLLRATLVRLGDLEDVLFLTMHHIAADGWSIGVLMRELSELYTAFVEGREPRLRELPVQYGDFARWQRERLRGGALDEGLVYWRGQLKDLPPPLELPPDAILHTDKPRTERDHEGATVLGAIGPALKNELEELSRHEGTTPFVTLLTAFMVLLMRCTGREDLLLGSPVSGRMRVETEGLVGLFLNTLALRARLSPALSFREAMARVRTAVLGGLDHSSVPIERVVQDLDLERTSTGQPLYETIFNFTPSAPRRFDMAGLSVQVEEAPALIEEFSTQLFVTELEGTLQLDLRYRSKRYTGARMAALLEQYLAVLAQVVRDAEQPIGALDLTTAGSRALLPDPATPLDAPAQRLVPHRIADWIVRAPEHTAILQGHETLTYADLGARLTAVADQLRSRGQQPGDVVAVLGPRSPGVITSMAGVLLSGGVLLTLSPDLPEQRHRLMLAESGARYLLRVGPQRDADRWLVAVPDLVILEVQSDGLLREPSSSAGSLEQYLAEADRRPGAATTHPAYVFFTSGSTGKPKGVLGNHGGLAHWLNWQRQTFDVGPDDRSGQLTGLSFDVVLRDIFLPLTSGATLVLPTEADVASGAATLRWLQREAISLLHTVPAVAEMWLLDRPAAVTLESLRQIFLAGEPLTATLVSRWRDAFPHAGEIVNIYGPTETTLAKCYYRLPATLRAGVQPLGATLPQTQALVLTPERKLCGIGEPGEIAIRTPFRSLGYINAPEENAQRFIPNPFSDRADDLLYLTGDRGVYGADGILEFRGRLDHQVKIRGVRVEPTEVATTLQASPDVASCAVIVRDDGPDGPALVAYVVLEKGAKENVGRLQELAAQRLPAAMVPSAFVFLDSLPLTSNQKLDRERLPAPERIRPKLASRYVAPRDATELRLVQIWEELLDVRPIGVTDRFFEVGGHSLLALRLLVEVEQKLGSKVPLVALFEEPTIEHLAAVLRQETRESPLLVTLRTGDRPATLFLVHPGGGVLWNYVHLVRHLPPGLPVYGLQARGLDGIAPPHHDLEQMASDYLSEIRRVQPDGPYRLAGHSMGGLVAFEMARQLQTEGQKVALLAMFDSAPPQTAETPRSVEDERHKDARSLTEMVMTIERFLGHPIGVTYEALAALSTDEQIDHVVEALKEHQALPAGEGTELTRNLLQVSKAHVEASRAYRPALSSLPITLIRADDAQPSGHSAASDETLGWSAFTTEPVSVLRSPGDHVTMMSGTHAETLAALLGQCLGER